MGSKILPVIGGVWCIERIRVVNQREISRGQRVVASAPRSEVGFRLIRRNREHRLGGNMNLRLGPKIMQCGDSADYRQKSCRDLWIVRVSPMVSVRL